MERYTAVFEWPDNEAPRISRSDNWMGGRIVACNFTDALTELRVLREAAQHYCDNYLRDEIDEPELCHDEHHRKAVMALWAALVPNVEVQRDSGGIIAGGSAGTTGWQAEER